MTDLDSNIKTLRYIYSDLSDFFWEVQLTKDDLHRLEDLLTCLRDTISQLSKLP